MFINIKKLALSATKSIRLPKLLNLLMVTCILSCATVTQNAQAGFWDFFNIFKKTKSLKVNSAFTPANLTFGQATASIPKNATSFTKWSTLGWTAGLLTVAAIVGGVCAYKNWGTISNGFKGITKWWNSKKPNGNGGLKEDKLEEKRLEEIKPEDIKPEEQEPKKKIIITDPLYIKLQEKGLDAESNKSMPNPNIVKSDKKFSDSCETISIDGICNEYKEFKNLSNQFHNDGYFYFQNNKSDVQVRTFFVKNIKQESNYFFSYDISYFALAGSKNEAAHNYSLAFMNVDKNLHILNADYLKILSPSYMRLKNDKEYKNLKLDELKGIQKEVIEGMSQLYKIHLQIKEEYLESFMKDFLTFITQNEYCKIIYQVKASKKFTPGLVIPNRDEKLEKPFPVIVAYLPILPGEVKDRNKILANILNAILDRYKDLDKDIFLDIKPRFNRQIKDFVYLAQDNGDGKTIYYDILKKGISIENKNVKVYNNVYTEDLAFFLGYEFDISLITPVNNNVEKPEEQEPKKKIIITDPLYIKLQEKGLDAESNKSMPKPNIIKSEKKFSDSYISIKVEKMCGPYLKRDGYCHFSNLKNQDKEYLFIKDLKDESNWFENFKIHQFGITNHQKLVRRNATYALMNVDKNFHIKSNHYCLNVSGNTIKLKDNKSFKDLQLADLKEMQKEAIEGISQIYKIHLQIKEEYLESFMKDFLHFITQNEYCKIISEVKALMKFEPGRDIPSIPAITDEKLEEAMAAIVVYLPLLPGEVEDRNKIIANVLNAILDRYKDLNEDIFLNVKPRFNRQIKDFIYLAQDNGDGKAIYHNLLKNGITNIDDTKTQIDNNVYTEDLAFFLGYEFDMSLIAPVNNNTEKPTITKTENGSSLEDNIKKITALENNIKKIIDEELEVDNELETDDTDEPEETQQKDKISKIIELSTDEDYLPNTFKLFIKFAKNNDLEIGTTNLSDYRRKDYNLLIKIEITYSPEKYKTLQEIINNFSDQYKHEAKKINLHIGANGSYIRLNKFKKAIKQISAIEKRDNELKKLNTRTRSNSI